MYYKELVRAHWIIRANVHAAVLIWGGPTNWNHDCLSVDDWRKARAIAEGIIIEVPWKRVNDYQEKG